MQVISAGSAKGSTPEHADLLPDLSLTDIMALRPSGLGSVTHAIRVGIAVTLSWLLATLASHSTYGLFAPITTLLVVQSSPLSTLSLSIQRILGTGIGVLLASVWVNAVGLSWWSFLVAILVSLIIARQLPWSLAGQLQIPVGVVFVLAMGPMNMQTDLWRVIDVVIGGAVGLLAVYVYPPRPRPGPMLAALDDYRDAVIQTVGDIADGCGALAQPLADDEDHEFLISSRALRARSDTAREALIAYASSAMLNPRGRIARAGLTADVERLRAVTAFALQVRGLAGAANRLYDRATPAALPVADFRAVMTTVQDLARLVLASPVGPDQDARVSDEEAGTEAGAAAERRLTEARALAAQLAESVRDCAAHILARHGDVGDVMESLGILSRVDYLQQQLMLVVDRSVEA